jgi:hypothetical protein
MYKIVSLFAVFIPHLSATTTRQLCRVVFALLAMTGRVTILNISRWTPQGGIYRTIQRFQHCYPLGYDLLNVFHTHLLDRESDYIIVGDETIKPISGDTT